MHAGQCFHGGAFDDVDHANADLKIQVPGKLSSFAFKYSARLNDLMDNFGKSITTGSYFLLKNFHASDT